MVAPDGFTRDDQFMRYPDAAADTRRFTAGSPRAVSVSADGTRVIFLRSGGPVDPVDRLWVYDVPTRTERMVVDPAALPALARGAGAAGMGTPAGLTRYATDAGGRLAALALGGRLVTADLIGGAVTGHDGDADVRDPRPDPGGRMVAYISDRTLRVRDLRTGDDTLLAGERGDAAVTWGMAEFTAAAQFGRERGFWWSPDGATILAARADTGQLRAAQPGVLRFPLPGSPTAHVTLHLLDLDGGWVDVHWDRETYPYLVSVSWSETGGPLITVLRRLQQHGLVLAIDPRTGETQVHAELADPRWVDPVPGTPCHLADGRVLIGGELAHDGYDARCLFADGSLLTPPSLYVRRVRGRLGPTGEVTLADRAIAAADGDLLVEASDGEPSEQHLFRVATHGGSGAVDVRRLTSMPGWHRGCAGGATLVVGSRSLDHGGTQWTVHVSGERVGELASLASPPPFAPRPALERVTDRRLPAGVLYPRAHVAGRRLPVLVDVHGGPGRQEVRSTRAAWQDRQWLADAGMAVVVVDNRGTPGVAPSFEKVIHRRLADMVLGDQVDGLASLADKHPDLDLSRVAIRGRGFGGWLAALAVLRRPDVYRCGIAVAPLTDWSLADAAFAERYLGPPVDAGEAYAHTSLLESAEEPPLRPDDARALLLVRANDEAVPEAHVDRLAAALDRSGRPFEELTVNEPDDARLLGPELEFLHRHLG
jgi:dipeptidyl-peptidase-4